MGLFDWVSRLWSERNAAVQHREEVKNRAFIAAKQTPDFFQAAALWNSYVHTYLKGYYPIRTLDDADRFAGIGDHLPPPPSNKEIAQDHEVHEITEDLAEKLNAYFCQAKDYDCTPYSSNEQLSNIVSLDGLDARVVREQIREWKEIVSALRPKGNFQTTIKNLGSKKGRTTTTLEAYGKIKGAFEQKITIIPRVYVDDARRLSAMSAFSPANKSEFNQVGVALFEFYFRRFYDEGRVERYDELVRSATLEKDRNSRLFYNIVSFTEAVENLGYSGLQELADYLDEQGVQTPQSFRARAVEANILLEQQMETVKAKYLPYAMEYMRTSLKHFEDKEGGRGNEQRLHYFKELCHFFQTEFS